MARAALHRPRVGLHVADRLHRHAQALGDDLRIGGLVALPVRFGADRDRHRAVGLEAHLGALVRRAARSLQETGDAQPAQAAARLGLGAAGLEARDVGTGHGAVEIVDEAARIDGQAHRRLVREGGDQVLAPQLGGIETELARRRFDTALGDVVGLGLAGAAVGVDRHCIGEGAEHVDGDRRDIVDAAMRGRSGDRRGARPVTREIGAEIGHHLDVERQEAAVLVEPEPGLRRDVAALGAGHELLGAIGFPAHRLAGLARGPQQQDPFGIEEVLGAEAAADVGRVQAEAVERQLEDELGELAADAVQSLPGQLEVEAVARGIVARDAGARLDRRHHDAVVHDVDLDDVRRLLHRRGSSDGIALLDVERRVLRRLRPEKRRTFGERGAAVDDGGQRVVVDLDQLRRRARCIGAVGDDERHGIADMAHALDRQRKARRHDQRRHRRHAGHRAEAREIGRGVDAANAVELRRRADVDPPNGRMGVR
jgi:hypothetical protein